MMILAPILLVSILVIAFVVAWFRLGKRDDNDLT